MTDKPLMLDDHKFLYNPTGEKLEAGYLLSDIQSAKRLLKQRALTLYKELEHFSDRQEKRRELLDMIDACFQIPDGK